MLDPSVKRGVSDLKMSSGVKRLSCMPWFLGWSAPGWRPSGVGVHLCSEEEIRSSKALGVSQKSALAELGGMRHLWVLWEVEGNRKFLRSGGSWTLEGSHPYPLPSGKHHCFLSPALTEEKLFFPLSVKPSIC